MIECQLFFVAAVMKCNTVKQYEIEKCPVFYVREEHFEQTRRSPYFWYTSFLSYSKFDARNLKCEDYCVLLLLTFVAFFLRAILKTKIKLNNKRTFIF
ncbi:unnamed protein product [Rotaria socialis]|uniref:Uncharacterized protein n=1 Tax=Rotaria socialis TaxID=392032 RepID=A0A818HMJ1_9BILA|nr:unnamed protein product [Rotaria socialis]CAF3511049.1 unnamed protein product [Rotaria socialis]